MCCCVCYDWNLNEVPFHLISLSPTTAVFPLRKKKFCTWFFWCREFFTRNQTHCKMYELSSTTLWIQPSLICWILSKMSNVRWDTGAPVFSQRLVKWGNYVFMLMRSQSQTWIWSDWGLLCVLCKNDSLEMLLSSSSSHQRLTNLQHASSALNPAEVTLVGFVTVSNEMCACSHSEGWDRPARHPTSPPQVILLDLRLLTR